MGKESKPEVPEPGRKQNAMAMQNPDFTRFNSPRNRSSAAGPGGPVLGTGDKADSKTDLVSALEGLTEHRGKQSGPQTRRSHAGRWGCVKRSPGGLREHSGGTSPSFGERACGSSTHR